jgi:hypothetical protein
VVWAPATTLLLSQSAAAACTPLLGQRSGQRLPALAEHPPAATAAPASKAHLRAGVLDALRHRVALGVAERHRRRRLRQQRQDGDARVAADDRDVDVLQVQPARLRDKGVGADLAGCGGLGARCGGRGRGGFRLLLLLGSTAACGCRPLRHPPTATPPARPQHQPRPKPTTSSVVTPSRRLGSYTPAALSTSEAMGTVLFTGLLMISMTAWGVGVGGLGGGDG